MSSTKKISAIFMAFALVMCMGYFSLMSPTTAWSYQSQSVNGSNNKFVFANFDVDGDYSIERSFRFDGATAFDDPDEDLFDLVVKVIDVEVKNEGGMPARVYSTVENSFDSKGLKYFYYTQGEFKNESVKDSMKEALNNNLTDQALDEYNNEHYILLNPGESKTVKVALWVEYDESGAEFAFEDSGWASIDYNINITLTATQDADEAMLK